MPGRVKGTVAMVTGAARGQGRSHAIRLAEEGADVIVLDVCSAVADMTYAPSTSAELEDTASVIKALGRRAIAIESDVRDIDTLKTAVDDAVAELGRLDIVSANAGVGLRPAPAHELAETVWNDMIDINLSGTWHTCKVAIPHLINGGRGGSIVLTSSAATLRPMPNMANYIAAKHGVVGLMRALALELGPRMIRVNSILTTLVNTPMIMDDKLFAMFCPDIESPTRDDFAAVAQQVNLLPVPWLEPTAVSDALLFLVSDDGRYITGVALPVDAGCSLK